ncbi:heparin lyase I family protein [Massilia sp. erpn]|uniref:heparin lyase I family protein n=1 Tax=Massilia sp. erpn TaxID=2738142 RepID=UPI002103A269|nr:heparin lyase I family protein [Massilia sp. erpn]UTY60501.1 hypothetical protein HPQ68_26880 [Massilia sp. erpn]
MSKRIRGVLAGVRPHFRKDTMQFKRYAGLLLGGLFAAHAGAADLPPGTPSEIGANFATLYGLRVQGGGGIAVRTDVPVAKGRPVVEVTLNNAGPALRNDFFLKGEQFPTLNGAEQAWRSYVISVFLPADGWVESDAPVTLAQIDSAVDGGQLPPPLAVQVRGSKLVLNTNFNHLPAGEATEANTAHRSIVIGTAEKNKWHCFGIQARWSATPAKGELYVHLNGNEVYFSRIAHNSYPSAVHVPRVGLSVPADASIGSRKIYADFIRVVERYESAPNLLSRTPCATAN